MKKRKSLKTGIVILLLAAAGILYSCRENREPDTAVLLKESGGGALVGNSVTEAAEGESTPVWQESRDGAKTNGNEPEDTGDSREAGRIETGKKPEETSKNTHEYIYIHICGAVKKPDVYKVEEDTRLVDVIKLAGGLTKEAAGDYVNQAALVQDGQKIYIPTEDEVKDTLPEGFAEPAMDSGSGNRVSEINEAAGNNSKSSGKVNINKASADELMTLAGIGEAKAAGILAYREEHGGFKSIEEIKNINGIKDSVFNKISDRITVD